MANTLSHQRTIIKVKKPVELDLELSILVNKIEFYLVTQSL
jgi:hypothetical protein